MSKPEKPLNKKEDFAKQLSSCTKSLFSCEDGRIWLKLMKQYVGFYRNELEQSGFKTDVVPYHVGRKDTIKYIESIINN